MDEDLQKQVAKVKELLDMGFITDEEFNRRMADMGVSLTEAVANVPPPHNEGPVPQYYRPTSPPVIETVIEPIIEARKPPPPPRFDPKRVGPTAALPPPPRALHNTKPPALHGSQQRLDDLPQTDKTGSENYRIIPRAGRQGYSVFDSATLPKGGFSAGAMCDHFQPGIVDKDIKDHSKSKEAVPERCFAMVRAASSAAKHQPPTCPTEGWALANAPIIYGLQPKGVVVHCRQDVYLQSGLLTGTVTLREILQRFKMSEGELIMCGTSPLLRVYGSVSGAATEVPHGYYELRPLRHRMHRMHWCDFSIDRAEYASNFHCQFQKNAQHQPYRLNALPVTPHEKFPSPFKVNPGLQFTILLRHLQAKFKVTTVQTDLQMNAMWIPYNDRSRSLHTLISDCTRTRTCFLCAKPSHFSCAFVCDAHFDQRLESLHAAAIAGSKSLEAALRDPSSTAECPGEELIHEGDEDLKTRKAYPADSAKFCYVKAEDLQSLTDAIGLRAKPENQ